MKLFIIQGVPKLVTQNKNSAVVTSELQTTVWSAAFHNLRLVLKVLVQTARWHSTNAELRVYFFYPNRRIVAWIGRGTTIDWPPNISQI